MLGYMGASLEPAVPEVGLGTGSAMGRLASWVKPVPGTTGLGLAPGAL